MRSCTLFINAVILHLWSMCPAALCGSARCGHVAALYWHTWLFASLWLYYILCLWRKLLKFKVREYWQSNRNGIFFMKTDLQWQGTRDTTSCDKPQSLAPLNWDHSAELTLTIPLSRLADIHAIAGSSSVRLDPAITVSWAGPILRSIPHLQHCRPAWTTDEHPPEKGKKKNWCDESFWRKVNV